MAEKRWFRGVVYSATCVLTAGLSLWILLACRHSWTPREGIFEYLPIPGAKDLSDGSTLGKSGFIKIPLDDFRALQAGGGIDEVWQAVIAADKEAHACVTISYYGVRRGMPPFYAEEQGIYQLPGTLYTVGRHSCTAEGNKLRITYQYDWGMPLAAVLLVIICGLVAVSQEGKCFRRRT